jgi:hypothetical protein
LLHDIGTREIIARLLENLDERLGDQGSIDVKGIIQIAGGIVLS